MYVAELPPIRRVVEPPTEKRVAEPPARERAWGDRSLLKSLKNPSGEKYEVRVHCPEVTFLGKAEQPDFACIDIAIEPRDRIIELKSLKRYLFGFRETLMSYERFINVLYKDLMETYRPMRLVVEMGCQARGGISSKLKIGRIGGRDRGSRTAFFDLPRLGLFFASSQLWRTDL
jgi:7-cyano-7-deazaguanine reductase